MKDSDNLKSRKRVLLEAVIRKEIGDPKIPYLLCALGMRDYLAVKVRYRLGSRNC